MPYTVTDVSLPCIGWGHSGGCVRRTFRGAAHLSLTFPSHRPGNGNTIETSTPDAHLPPKHQTFARCHFREHSLGFESQLPLEGFLGVSTRVGSVVL